MRNNKSLKIFVKIIIWSVVILLSFQIIRTIISHLMYGKYDNNSWELVWPVLVSTLIAVFGTLVTSYVFLKDALDRTIDEKPHYTKVIERYRQEKINALMWYSIVFIGVSCYLILFQSAGNGSASYNCFLYMGILVVACLLVFSVHFLYQCINIDRTIYNSAQEVLTELDIRIHEQWLQMKESWNGFIDRYTEQRGESIQTFLEVDDEETGGFDVRKFIVKFSEWEKFILAFVDRTAELQRGQSAEERILIATGYIDKLGVIQRVERDDAKEYDWKQYAYADIQRYKEWLEDKMSMDDFLNIYRYLSDYRDALQVSMDKKTFFRSEEVKNKERGTDILYLLFLLRFYSSLKCLVTIPRVELFYPAVKMHNVDFYNVRFENTSFRASSFSEVVFARINMVGSNLAFSKFAGCNFYNADIRDCSLGNSLFENCLMSEMILSDVDVTGTIFDNVNLKGSTFVDAVIGNVEFRECSFFYTVFHNCKLSQVSFKNVKDRCFIHSSFEQSVLQDVYFQQECNEQQIPDQYLPCNENYFRNLVIENRSDGRRQRKTPGIWEGLEEFARRSMNMQASFFEKVSAEGIKFYNMALDSSIFSGSDMQKSCWKNVYMKGCVMEETNLTEAQITYSDMESCAMTDAVLYKTKFRLVNLQNSGLSGCHASESNWKCCILDKSDLSRIDLTKSQVEYSSFRDTIITEAELTNACFKEVIFENSNGQGLLSSYSHFEKCCFINAFLPAANFNYTYFVECNLKLASLAGSTIVEAGFEACDFENSNFRNCCFIKVSFKNNRNVCPEIFENSRFINCVFEGGDEECGSIITESI